MLAPTHVDCDPGKVLKNATDETIPFEAVLALRGALKMVNIERDPGKIFQFGQKDYKLADLFAIIDAEDAASLAAEGVGSSAGGAAGSDGGGSAGGGGGTAERKGSHCMIRLVGTLVKDDICQVLINSRLQANRAQLDASALGSRTEVWLLTARRFRDPDHPVTIRWNTRSDRDAVICCSYTVPRYRSSIVMCTRGRGSSI